MVQSVATRIEYCNTPQRFRTVLPLLYLETSKTNILAARLVKEFTMNCDQVRCLNESVQILSSSMCDGHQLRGTEREGRRKRRRGEGREGGRKEGRAMDSNREH